MEQVKHYIISGEFVERLHKQSEANEKANADDLSSIIGEVASLENTGHIIDIERVAGTCNDIERRTNVNGIIGWILDNIEEADIEPVYTTYDELMGVLAIFKAMDDDSAGEDEWTRAYRAGKLAGAIDIVSNVFGFTTRRIKADLEGTEE